MCWEGLPAVEPSHADSMSMDMERVPADAMGADSTQDLMQQGAHQQHGSPSHSEHCVFGTACSAGPIFHLTLPSYLSSAQQLPASAFSSIAVAVRVVHLPQPRAPPGRLS
jgi:hypothetical protein